MSDFIIQQGTDGSYSWPLLNEDGTDFNPAGWSAKMSVKGRHGALLHTFDLDSENLSLVDGEVVISWSAADTLEWDWAGGSYDLLLYSASQHHRVSAGYVQISKTVTTI
jgi:hypothetical protein